MNDERIEEIFKELEGNSKISMNQMAEIEGISRSTLTYRLKKADETRYSQILEERKKSGRKWKTEERKRLKGEENKNNIRLLDGLGISEKTRHSLLSFLNKDKHTSMTEYKFNAQLLELLTFFLVGRNKEIDRDSESYLTKEDVIHMIRVNPRIMTNDVKRKINPRCRAIESLPWADEEKVNKIVKKAPAIFDESDERFTKQMLVAEAYEILLEKGYVQNLTEYMLTEKAHQQMKTSPEKMYQRLSAFRDEKNSNILTEDEYWHAIRNSSMDENNKSKYVLPEYEKGKEEDFRKELQRKTEKETAEEKVKE